MLRGSLNSNWWLDRRLGSYPIKQDWTTKLPAGTPLRTDGHWSVQGLVGCWLFNEGTGKIAFADTGANLALGSTSETVFTTNGVRAYGSTGTMKFGNVRNIDKNKGSLVLVLSPESASSSTSQKWLFGGNGNCLTLIKSTTANRMQIYVDGRDSQHAVSFVAGQRVLFVSTWDKSSGDLWLYQDGIKCTRASISGTYGSTTLTSLALGSASGGSLCYAATYITALIYNRALSPQEVASISANPYQVCQP